VPFFDDFHRLKSEFHGIKKPFVQILLGRHYGTVQFLINLKKYFPLL